MAVAFDAASESAAQASVASQTWTHTPAGTPRGIIVFCHGWLGSTDIITGVTYGGVAMTAVPDGFANDTATELGFCKAYFLGASIPTGAQSVVVSRTNNTVVTYNVAYSVTAAGDTEITGVTARSENQSPAEWNVDDGSPGTDSLRFASMYNGHASIQAAGANSTTPAGIGHDGTALGASSVRETTAGQGSRPVGFSTIGGIDDHASVVLAVREPPSGAPTPIPHLIQPRNAW